MAIFDKDKKEEKKDDKKKVAKKEIKPLGSKNSKSAYDYLVEPWITEKSHGMMGDNKYVFKVTRNSSKEQIKKAVEGLYEVVVKKIATVNIPDSVKYFGRHVGTKVGHKKAIVTLKKGDTIEIFGGAK